MNHHLQIEMEKLFDKNQLIPRIRAEFEADKESLASHLSENAIDYSFGLDLLVQMVLHKRATVGMLVGAMKKHFDGDCQRTADELVKCVEADLVDFDANDGEDGRFIVRYEITSAVQKELDVYQYPLPMVCEPLTLKSNTQTAYLTQSRSSVILKRVNHHDEDVCLDHLNRMNAIPLRINHETVKKVSNTWKGIDHRREKETYEDFKKRRKAFLKYDRTAKDIHDHIDLAGGVFYLTHKYDKRGRTYCAGYHVTYQGHDFNKASIEFANGEIVTG